MINLKMNLKKLGWNSVTLAQALGISQPAASKIINGNPSLSSLQKIADIVGCSVSQLLSDGNDAPEEITLTINGQTNTYVLKEQNQ